MSIASENEKIVTNMLADLGEATERVKTLQAVNENLLLALKGLQFTGPRFRCPDCGGKPATGHLTNQAGHFCRTGAAIKAAEEII